jgi:hypothetical protein
VSVREVRRRRRKERNLGSTGPEDLGNLIVGQEALGWLRLGLVPGSAVGSRRGVWVRWKAGGVANLEEERWCPCAGKRQGIQAHGLWG